MYQKIDPYLTKIDSLRLAFIDVTVTYVNPRQYGGNEHTSLLFGKGLSHIHSERAGALLRIVLYVPVNKAHLISIGWQTATHRYS